MAALHKSLRRATGPASGRGALTASFSIRRQTTTQALDVLRRVSAAGGVPTPVTPLGAEVGYYAPSFLPDGKRFLFTAFGEQDRQGIYLATLDGPSPTRLTSDVSAAHYLPSGSSPPGASAGDGWLVWVRNGTLVAQRLDLTVPALAAGEPVSVADNVGFASPPRGPE